MSQTQAWIGNAKRLFAASFFAWCFAAGLVLFKVSFESIFGSGFSTIYIQPVLAMFAALPGVFYFYLQSRKMDADSLVEANRIFDKIMKFQKPTAIAAFVGGGIGFLPFLVNFLGFFGLLGRGVIPVFWANIEMMVPWVSLYGFIAFSIAAMVINRQRLTSKD